MNIFWNSKKALVQGLTGLAEREREAITLGWQLSPGLPLSPAVHPASSSCEPPSMPLQRSESPFLKGATQAPQVCVCCQYECPPTAANSCLELGGWKQQKPILSQSWRREVQSSSCLWGHAPSGGSRERSFQPLPASGCSWHVRPSSLCLCLHVAFLLCSYQKCNFLTEGDCIPT